MDDHYYQQNPCFNNNNFHFSYGVEDPYNYHGVNNSNINMNNGKENRCQEYQGFNCEQNRCQEYQGFNGEEIRCQEYQGFNGEEYRCQEYQCFNGEESRCQEYQGFNDVTVNYGLENYQQYQDLNNNIVNVNNAVEDHNYYQQHQELDNNVNVNNGVEDHYYQQHQDLKNNVIVNNGVEDHYYQEDQELNSNVNNNEGLNVVHVVIEYLDSLPVGFRFFPTDDELVYYLTKKVNNEELPPNRIHEVEFYKFSPHDLAAFYPPNDGNEWFFFATRYKKYKNGSRPRRNAGNGYWKASGKDRPITNLMGVVVGFKKTLVYYKLDGKKPPHGVKTNWILHEYTVKDPPEIVKDPNNNMKLDEVLCRIHHNDGRTKDAVDDQSSSVAAAIPPPQSADVDNPLTSSLHSQDNAVHDTDDQANQNNPNADDFLPSINPVSTVDPNIWQLRENYSISNSNVQVNPLTTDFNNLANVQVNPSIQDFNHSGHEFDYELQCLLDSFTPHDGVITLESVPTEVTAQQSASTEDIAQQSFTLGGVITQESAPTQNVTRQSVLGEAATKQSASGIDDIMLYINFDSDFKDSY